MADNNWTHGFYELRHLAADRVTEVGVQTIWEAVQRSADEHTRNINNLMAALVTPTSEWKRKIKQPIGAVTLQPLDNRGIPGNLRYSGSYDVAIPIMGAGLQWGGDRVARAKMTVEEANAATLTVMQADADWIRRHILAAILHPAAWTFTDDQYGDLTIQPLANSDTVVYNRRNGQEAAIDNHYLAQADAISDSANPFDDIFDELYEHPVNGTGQVVCYVPTNLRTSIKALTDFVSVGDLDIQKGANSDTIPAPIQAGFGDRVLGKVAENGWIVEWGALPSGVMMCHAVEGGPVLSMREHAEAELQGLQTEEFDEDGNTQGTRLTRYAGFAVTRREGLVVYQVGAASYSAPTGYTAMPLPL